MVLPFICPADHIFRLNEWVGHNIAFREYSFMRNPRLMYSAAWQSAPAVVSVCSDRGGDLAACPDRTSTSGVPAMVPAGSTDVQLRRYLQPLAHTKVC